MFSHQQINEIMRLKIGTTFTEDYVTISLIPTIIIVHSVYIEKIETCYQIQFLLFRFGFQFTKHRYK